MAQGIVAHRLLVLFALATSTQALHAGSLRLASSPRRAHVRDDAGIVVPKPSTAKHRSAALYAVWFRHTVPVAYGGLWFWREDAGGWE